jgi:hypothetical protein
MNQNRGHWLLLNVLTTTITFIMEMEVALLQLFSGPKMFDPFEAKILFLQKSMQLEVIKVIKPFLEFLRFFYVEQVHNMVASCWIHTSRHYALWKTWWDVGM